MSHIVFLAHPFFLLAHKDTRAHERAELVGNISSSVDRNVRRGMVETVATPLAKLVVNTARQVVVDPLQVCVCVVIYIHTLV